MANLTSTDYDYYAADLINDRNKNRYETAAVCFCLLIFVGSTI